MSVVGADVDEFRSRAVFLGTVTALNDVRAISFAVLDQGLMKGELSPLKVLTLASAPALGAVQHQPVFAVTEGAGLWVLDGGNLLKNPGAELPWLL